MAGERIEVMPPSMSFAPAEEPASLPVTRSLLPLTVVPSCLAPLELTASGSPRSHWPVVAVSVLLGLIVQPAFVSKLSKKIVAPVGVLVGVEVNVGVGVMVADVGVGVGPVEQYWACLPITA